jgi:hypothetical protein
VDEFEACALAGHTPRSRDVGVSSAGTGMRSQEAKDMALDAYVKASLVLLIPDT